MSINNNFELNCNNKNADLKNSSLNSMTKNTDILDKINESINCELEGNINSMLDNMLKDDEDETPNNTLIRNNKKHLTVQHSHNLNINNDRINNHIYNPNTNYNNQVNSDLYQHSLGMNKVNSACFEGLNLQRLESVPENHKSYSNNLDNLKLLINDIPYNNNINNTNLNYLNSNINGNLNYRNSLNITNFNNNMCYNNNNCNNEMLNQGIRRQDRNLSKTVKMGNNKLFVNTSGLQNGHYSNSNFKSGSNNHSSLNGSFSSIGSQSPNKKSNQDKRKLSNSNNIR